MVRTYDAKKVIVIVGGVPIGGFSENSFVKISRKNDTFTIVAGAQGDISRSKSNDKTGELSLTLQQTSPSNEYLSKLALKDETDNLGIVPIKVHDVSGVSNFTSAFAWIRKPADIEYGKDIADIEWVFDLSDITMNIGGNF